MSIQNHLNMHCLRGAPSMTIIHFVHYVHTVTTGCRNPIWLSWQYKDDITIKREWEALHLTNLNVVKIYRSYIHLWLFFKFTCSQCIYNTRSNYVRKIKVQRGVLWSKPRNSQFHVLRIVCRFKGFRCRPSQRNMCISKGQKDVLNKSTSWHTFLSKFDNTNLLTSLGSYFTLAKLGICTMYVHDLFVMLMVDACIWESKRPMTLCNLHPTTMLIHPRFYFLHVYCLKHYIFTKQLVQCT